MSFKKTNQQEIEEFVAKAFGDENVGQLLLLVDKDNLENTASILKGCEKPLMAMVLGMSETSAEKIRQMNGNPDNFVELMVVCKESDTPYVVDHITANEEKSMVTPEARAQIDFLDPKKKGPVQ